MRTSNSYAKIAERAKAMQHPQTISSPSPSHHSSTSLTSSQHPKTPATPSTTNRYRSSLSERAAQLLERTLKRDASVKPHLNPQTESFSTVSSGISNLSSMGSFRDLESASVSSGDSFSAKLQASQQKHRRSFSSPEDLENFSAPATLSHSGAERKFHQVLERAKRHVGKGNNTPPKRPSPQQTPNQTQNGSFRKSLGYVGSSAAFDVNSQEIQTKLDKITKTSAKLSELTEELHKDHEGLSTWTWNLQNTVTAQLSSKAKEYEASISDLKERLEQAESVGMERKARYDTLKRETKSQIAELENQLKRLRKNYETELEQNQNLRNEISSLKLSLSNNSMGQEIRKMKAIYEDKLSQAAEVIQMLNVKIEEGEFENNEPKVLRRALARARKEIKDLRDKIASAPQIDVSNPEHESFKQKFEKEKELREKTEEFLEKKVGEYQEVLNDEKELIKSLQRKLMRAKENNKELTEQVMLARSSQGEDIPTELVDLYNDLRGLMDPEEEASLRTDDSVNLTDKVNAQQTLIKMLLARVKSEERQRLKTEEQTATMISEQEKTILFLERKVKDLESLLKVQKEETEQEREEFMKYISPEKLKQFQEQKGDEPDAYQVYLDTVKSPQRPLSPQGTHKRKRYKVPAYMQEARDSAIKEEIARLSRDIPISDDEGLAESPPPSPRPMSRKETSTNSPTLLIEQVRKSRAARKTFQRKTSSPNDPSLSDLVHPETASIESKGGFEQKHEEEPEADGADRKSVV